VEDARGHGYATEAMSAAIDEAFSAGELEEMQACCVPENLSSRAVLNRTGFSEERTIRGGAVIRGRHVDVVLYRMTRSEWRRLAMPATRRQMRS
jgi:ribosomal-protein-alanine N-acetyltransferase